jgi:sulfite exporter TauE/SafE
MDSIDIVSLITIAFLGSVGHCIGMCGGIVIAYSSAKIDGNSSKWSQSAAHLLYSLGRVTTYTALGAIFGAIGGVFSINNIAIATMTILAGIFMILAGLSLIGKFNFLTKLEHSFSKTSWYQKLFRETIASKSLASFYILGLLNGLLPCGLVYFFAVTAASTGSPIWGAVVMLIFGLSTIPSLFTLGFFSGLFTKGGFRQSAMTLASIVVVLYGIYTIYRGYDYIKHPNKSLLNCCSTEEGNDTAKQDSKVKPFSPMK